MKKTITVSKGTGQSFRRELVYAGVRLQKENGSLTTSQNGGNDVVEYDDNDYDSSEETTINGVIQSHDPQVVAPISGNMTLNAHFVEDEVVMIDKMSSARRRDIDCEELLTVLKEMGQENIEIEFIG